jgi:hypothetical protein
MPKKRPLSNLSYRVEVQRAFDAAHTSLVQLNVTLRHYASRGHAVRTSAAALLRQLEALQRDLAKKIKEKARHI